MISRYTRAEMAKIWDDRNRYRVWLEVELAVCEELARNRLIPRKDWTELKSKASNLLRQGGVDPERVEEHEKTTRHDVIAFTTAVAEKVGPTARYIHFGLTSSDVVDTSLSIMALRAGEILVKDIQKLLRTLQVQARRYKKLPTIGRSHGIFAEPTSFGLKFLGWHAEWQRNLKRVEDSLKDLAFGKLSGAVGVNAHLSPAQEKKILKTLGLKREPVSTQVIPRDRHAGFMNAIALCGASLERMSVELRHLQRSEVAEVMEGFKKGQKGSSAMPHKRNPISTENITGCARLLRSYAHAAMEDIALWHERDISHSSVERVIFPDATILLDYALNRMDGVLRELVVRKENVAANLSAAGTTAFSGHFLLELVSEGVSREEAYSWVQECALQSFEKKKDFVSTVAKHPKIAAHLSDRRIKELGSLKYQLRNVDAIFDEVL